MSNIAIRVENLGKMYRLGSKKEAYSTLRDTITQSFSAPFRHAVQLFRRQANEEAAHRETLWALKDVSFEIKHGEVVGIIGKNGAGKSTLLKILSEITEPTVGHIDVFGRVGSLLEVGTGFHPELTGRENIYLNGAILGMTRAEINRKFDEIVDFSGVEKFLDTAVKHYSSGMGLRLGFAVAAHLEPDVLVVDEVLAVGDAEFQKKCLGKMQDVASQGRTVLFVSHNMGAVTQLCSRAILLQQGTLTEDDTTQTVINSYLNSIASQASEYIAQVDPAKPVQLLAVKTENMAGEATSTYAHNEAIRFVLEVTVREPLPNLVIGLVAYDYFERRIFTIQHPIPATISSETFRVTVVIPDTTFTSGNYRFGAALHVPNILIADVIENASFINIYDGGSEFAIYGNVNQGVVFVKSAWEFSEI